MTNKNKKNNFTRERIIHSINLPQIMQMKQMIFSENMEISILHTDNIFEHE